MSAPIEISRPVTPIEAARLFILHGMDTADIAAAMGIREAHAARLLSTGRVGAQADKFRAIARRRAEG